VMNKGVDLASGQYISHLHADDFFLNHELVASVVDKIISSKPSGWYTGLNLSVDYNGNILDLNVPEKYRFEDMMVADIIKHPGTFIEREKFLAIKFSSRYKYAMDYFFFLNLWRKFGDPVVINDIDVVFRIHQNSLSSNYLRSLSSEMKARLDFRSQEKEYLFIPSDIVIYLLRVVKTFIYHYPLVYLNKLKFAKPKIID
jgi:glycosyltransferase involved in cell wall biosynthesis